MNRGPTVRNIRVGTESPTGFVEGIETGTK